MTDGLSSITAEHVRTRLGETLRGKWQLDHLLGVGGMAAVYAATHRNGKRVAVKILHRELSLNAVVRERFLREGYVANSVGHSGAVSVDDDDVTEDGCAFLVMELLDGETLEARWERKGRRLPADEVLALMDQVLGTLVAAHEKGIVHRDLKPENLFLTRDGFVKVLDFGIARARQASLSSSKTQTGSVMGTPAFMPPEQARGRWDEVDARTDLWAIGATMFTLLTGAYVHEAGTMNEALVLAVTSRARSLRSVRGDLAKEVVEFIDRSLQYEKDARFRDADEMQHALRVAYSAMQSAMQERHVAAVASTLVSAEAPVAVPSATMADIPSSASAPHTPAFTTHRGVGGSLVARTLDSPKRQFIAFVAAAVLVGTAGVALGLRGSSGDARDPGVAGADSGVVSAPSSAISDIVRAASSVEPRGATVAPRASSSVRSDGPVYPIVGVDQLPSVETPVSPSRPVASARVVPAPLRGSSSASPARPPAVRQPVLDPFAARE